MKKIMYIVFMLIMLFGFNGVYAHNFDNSVKVYDYAQVLTDDEESNLKDQVNEYINNYKLDMCIVVVRYYNHENIDEYAKEFYTVNNFGIGSNKSGLIIALDVNNNSSILTFGDANNLYDDSEISIIKNVFNKKDYYKELSDSINSINKYAKEDISVEEFKKNNFIQYLFIVVTSLLIPTVIVLFTMMRVRSKEVTSEYKEQKGFFINKRQDTLITTKTKKIIKKH